MARRSLRGAAALARVALLVGLAGLGSDSVRSVGADTLELEGGAMMRGEVLRRTADRVVVDLGFRVVEVPTAVVVRITGDEVEEGQDLGAGLGLKEGARRPLLTLEEAVARCAEAVVQVRTPVGLGSGFVVDPSGYVVTNQHVVAGEHRITVTVFRQDERGLDRLRFDRVAIVALSPEMDLALLRVEDGGDHTFATVSLGAGDPVRQGESVFAVGSPLGLDRTVSRGIVSAPGRVVDGRLLVQNTVNVNPGDSGGPLLNLRGEVVGVNELKLVGVGLEGLSFAIPAVVLRTFLDNRAAFAFDPRNPNAGFRYNPPPRLEASTGGSIREQP